VFRVLNYSSQDDSHLAPRADCTPLLHLPQQAMNFEIR
jgi:hypothetical protein